IANLNEQLEKNKKQFKNHQSLTQSIEKSKIFIENCKLFYNKYDKYKTAYLKIGSLKNEYTKLEDDYKKEKKQLNTYIAQLNGREPDYKKIEQLNEKIHKLDNDIKTYKQNEQHKNEYLKLQEKKADKTARKKKIDLNNKQEIISKIQAAIAQGDTCPVCGNEVHTLETHIDFDELTTRHEKIAELEQKHTDLKEQKIKLDSEIHYILEQLNKFNLDELEKTNYKALEQCMREVSKTKIQLETENETITKLKDKVMTLNQKIHEF